MAGFQVSRSEAKYKQGTTRCNLLYDRQIWNVQGQSKFVLNTVLILLAGGAAESFRMALRQDTHDEPLSVHTAEIDIKSYEWSARYHGSIY